MTYQYNEDHSNNKNSHYVITFNEINLNKIFPFKRNRGKIKQIKFNFKDD